VTGVIVHLCVKYTALYLLPNLLRFFASGECPPPHAGSCGLGSGEGCASLLRKPGKYVAVHETWSWKAWMSRAASAPTSPLRKLDSIWARHEPLRYRSSVGLS
jgi:hypothetical protein